MGKLFLVSTPIGNLEDITLRALRVLCKIRFILAEDTRLASKLMHYYDIRTIDKTVLSFFEGNEESRISEAISRLQAGVDIAIVSESGTPLISDPGYKLVREALQKGITVESIPGPTALISALTSSGLPTNAFLFLGFLPKRVANARKVLEGTKLALLAINQLKSVIIYESPHRILRTLQLIKELFGNIQIVIAREMTKVHEEIIREDVDSTLTYFTENKPRGEFVICFSLE